MANIKEQAAAVNMLPNARLTAAQVINSVFSDGAYAQYSARQGAEQIKT